MGGERSELSLSQSIDSSEITRHLMAAAVCGEGSAAAPIAGLKCHASGQCHPISRIVHAMVQTIILNRNGLATTPFATAAG
jgi:hypothetical protein